MASVQVLSMAEKTILENWCVMVMEYIFVLGWTSLFLHVTSSQSV